MRINPKAIIIGIIFVGLVVYALLNNDTTDTSNVTDLDDLNQRIANMALDFDSHQKFTLDFDPGDFNYDDAMEIVALTDPYQAANSMSYTYAYSENGDGTWSFSLDINYMGTKSQIKRADKRIKQLVEKMDGMSDYEKVKAVHDYVILYCDYGWDGIAFKSIEQGPYWTLYPGLAVCNGYALTFYRTMQMCDIPVTFEVGDSHAWNTVCINGEWYNIDLTWDDLGDEVGYTYFLKNTSDFKGHHHSEVTAEKSMEVTGASAQENYEMFPDYKVAYRMYLIAKYSSPVVILIIIIVINNKRKAFKRKRWAKRQMQL